MDYATPNLPSRDFDVTEAFYLALGFSRNWRDDGWMILERGDLVIEFFLHRENDPATSLFSACLRLDDVDAFYAVCQKAGLPETHLGWPRIHAPKMQPWGRRMGALIDPDGTLLRLIENEASLSTA